MDRFPTELRQAVKDCRDRGLIAAAKWASELLTSIPPSSRSAPPISAFPDFFFQTSTPSRPGGIGRPSSPTGGGGRPSLSTFSPSDFLPPPSQPLPSHNPPSSEEEDLYDLGKSYFDAKELERCAWTLRECQTGKAGFLRIYAKFLSADKRMQEGLPSVMGTQDDRHFLSPSFQPLLAELSSATDPFLLYLKGMMLFRLHKRPEAAECFVLSLEKYPCNWSCWLGLASCVKSTDELEAVLPLLPSGHPFTHCFEIHTRLDLHTATETVDEMITDLEEKVFSIASTPQGKQKGKAWIWGVSMKGMVAYHQRDFARAEAAFDAVQKLDPFRLDDVDVYSNMLYVMPKLSKLAQLAKEYCDIDRNRAETCCLIGNFYSSRGEHPKAIQYFKRSLQLNRDYLPAWTLMGHEYVEMKNSHAAIEAYRRAVDVNPRDYRAWYGLGQTYELLDMAHYAIQYYNKATALRPYDSRMWLALAQVYENTGRIHEAISCHQRALVGAEQPTGTTILTTLARLYDVVSDYPAAAASHRRLLNAWSSSDAGAGGKGAPVASYLWLAKYELRGGDQAGEAGGGAEANWGLAAQYLQGIVKHNVQEKEEAETLLKQIADHQSIS
ncbi:hypothetical protein BDY24DRAFT_418699 [Mrakia frigida]|uniref:anaphase promoting complex subunit CDC23 n=1 Tax=Mrakia frigida TaxID=29902 RepID=UPI003FCC0A42